MPHPVLDTGGAWDLGTMSRTKIKRTRLQRRLEKELGKRKSSKAGGGAGRLNCASGWGQGGRSLPGGHRLRQLLPPQGCVPFWPGQLGLSLGWWGARGVVGSSLPGDTCPCSSCSPLPPQGPAARLPLEQSSGWKSGPGQPGRPTRGVPAGPATPRAPRPAQAPTPLPTRPSPVQSLRY